MAKTTIISEETLKEMQAILKQIKNNRLINNVMTGIYEPSDRYVKFDALQLKIGVLLLNCNDEVK